MELKDALTITGLGMAVVFSGLLLTAGLIFVFGRLQGLLESSDDHVEIGSTAKPPLSAQAEVAAGPPIEPEILTVIATVLEIEHRLRRVGPDSRKRAPSS